MAKKKKLSANQLGKLRARIKYAPERDTITGLTGQAVSQYGSDLRDTDTTAKSTIQFAKGQRKPVTKVFDEAKTAADNSASDVAAAFGSLGTAADPFRAVTAREQGGRTQRLAQARADALHDLTNRQLDAKAGRQFGRLLAQKQLNTTLSDLGERLRSLGDKEGAFAVEQAATLDRESANRRSTRRTAKEKIASSEKIAANKITSQQKIAADKLAASGGKVKGLPKGVKPATQDQLNAFESDFAKAVRYAKELSADYSASEVKTLLTKGSPASKDKATGEVLGGIPSIGNQLALQAAVDMAFGTHLRGRTVRRIHSKGIRLSDIPGLTTKPSKRLGRKRTVGLGQRGV